MNLGVLRKGRSPSHALNSIMRSEAPYVLAKKIHLAGVHLPSWSIRADAPSRQAPVSEPRVAVPPWFWRLPAGVAKASDLDTLEGLPRAFNRWALLAGSLLLRSISSSTSEMAGKTSRAACEGPRDRAHALHQGRLAGEVSNLATWSSTGLLDGVLGSAPHRYFIRMDRRIYDFYVRTRRESSSCGGDSEWSGTILWLAEVLACRALEPHTNLGQSGASGAPPTIAGSSFACTCYYCAAVGLVAHGGGTGPWLFWAVETIRAYRFATSGFGLICRSSWRRLSVYPNRPAKDPQQSRYMSTWEGRRARDRCLHRDAAELSASRMVLGRPSNIGLTSFSRKSWVAILFFPRL